MVESVCFRGEIIFEGLIESVIDFTCDFFAIRHDNQTKQSFSSITK
jgi:hypothetical protein